MIKQFRISLTMMLLCVLLGYVVVSYALNNQPNISLPPEMQNATGNPSTTLEEGNITTLLGVEELKLTHKNTDNIANLLGTEELARPPVNTTMFPRLDTLQNVYNLLYEQKLYVYPDMDNKTHQNALVKLARKKRLTLEELTKRLKQFRQRNIQQTHQLCTMARIHSWVKDGREFRLCFDPHYRHLDNSTYRCEKQTMPGKLKVLTYRQATSSIEQLNKESSTKDWRIPTIDELFALTQYLPYPTTEGTVYKFWSATGTSHQGEGVWVVVMDVMDTGGGRLEYRPRLDKILLTSSETTFLFPVRTCQHW